MSSETISSEQLAERQKVYTENFSRSLQEQVTSIMLILCVFHSSSFHGLAGADICL